jgi:hypothetical protein
MELGPLRSADGKILPSKTKQIQTKMLGFAWFYSSESGLFNGLQRFQIRNSLLPFPPPSAAQGGGLSRRSGQGSVNSDFHKGIV